jgi:hypothetical protein
MADNVDDPKKEGHEGELTSGHIDDPANEAHERECAPNPTDLPNRKDRGRLHGGRNSVLSRALLEVLRRDGENIRKLRAMEGALRKALRPEGPLAEVFFDRFFASILRLIVASRLEEKALNQEKTEAPTKSLLPELYQKFAPMLVTHGDEDNSAVRTDPPGFNTELLHQLSLIGRYDRAAGREQYRSLTILVLLRDHGDDLGLRNWVSATVGFKPTP